MTFSGFPYDCRVSVSTEVEIPPPPQGLPSNFEAKRHKVKKQRNQHLKDEILVLNRENENC
jgi:hypothetical protein